MSFAPAALLALLALASGCDAPIQPEIVVPEEGDAVETPPSLAVPTVPESEAGPTRVSVRDVLVTVNGLLAGIAAFDGTVHPVGGAEIPLLNDPDTYLLRLQSAEIALPTATLAEMLTRQTEKAEKQPFEELEILPQGDVLLLRGRLKTMGIKVELVARPFATKDGRLGLELAEATAGGIRLDKTLNKLGIHLDDLARMKQRKREKRAEREGEEPADRNEAIDITNDRIVVDVFRFVTRPQVEAAITGVAVTPDGVIVRVGGEAGQQPVEAASVKEGLNDDRSNYIALRGGTARFGKSTLHDVDFTLVDQDPSDPLLIAAADFGRQFRAGYMKPQSDGGTVAYFPDRDQVSEAEDESEEAIAGIELPK